MSQFPRCRLRRIRLLRSGQKMQSFFRRRHQTVEKRDIHAVQILQSVEYSELWPQVEMKRCVSNRGEIDEHHIAVRLLKSDRGIDRSGGTSGTALGAEE